MSEHGLADFFFDLQVAGGRIQDTNTRNVPAIVRRFKKLPGFLIEYPPYVDGSYVTAIRNRLPCRYSRDRHVHRTGITKNTGS